MKKMSFMILVLVLFIWIVIGTENVSAQSSCSCSNATCSASQTCASGFTAVCTCSATGCSSHCAREGGILDFSESSIASKLQNESIENIGKVLSKNFGKFVTFKPTNSEFKFEYSNSNSLTASHWDILEYLVKNGNLKINGHDLEFWKGYRQTLLKGGEFKLCVGSAPAQMVLNEISFITGRKYSISSGNPQTKIQGEIKGNSLGEILNNLSKQGQITIVEN